MREQLSDLRPEVGQTTQRIGVGNRTPDLAGVSKAFDSPVLAADVDGGSLVVVLALLVELSRFRELLEEGHWDQM